VRAEVARRMSLRYYLITVAGNGSLSPYDGGSRIFRGRDY